MQYSFSYRYSNTIYHTLCTHTRLFRSSHIRFSQGNITVCAFFWSCKALHPVAMVFVHSAIRMKARPRIVFGCERQQIHKTDVLRACPHAHVHLYLVCMCLFAFDSIWHMRTLYIPKNPSISHRNENTRHSHGCFVVKTHSPKQSFVWIILPTVNQLAGHTWNVVTEADNIVYQAHVNSLR